MFEVVNDSFLEILELYVKNFDKNTPTHAFVTMNKTRIIIQIYVLFAFLLAVTIFWTVMKKDFWSFCLIIGYPIMFFASFSYFYFKFVKTFLLYWGNAAMKILLQNLKKGKDQTFRSSLIMPSSGTLTKNLTNNYNNPNANSHLQPITSNSGVNVNINQNANSNVVNTERDAINDHLPRSKSFFENEYFLEFSFREHLGYYVKFLFEGIEKSFNLLYTCSSLNSINY